MKEIKNPTARIFAEYGLITLAIWILSVGVYFFKFPNHFAFGGVTGFAIVISEWTGMSAGTFTNVMNLLLLIIGFIFLGKGVGIRTVYATVWMTASLAIMERLYPLHRPLTNEPLLELFFAIALPAFSTALLFHIGATSGGTDIIAMILRKHTSWNIGTALMVVDIASVVMAFVIFGPATGLFSSLGLLAKSLIVDEFMETFNLCKCFNIVCDNPDPICAYIINNLHRGATVYEAHGAFSNHNKTVIMTTMKRSQAVKLRNYIREVEPSAFILISNSSEIIGKGFMTC